MTRTGRRVIYGILVFLAAIVLSGTVYISSLFPIITGYAAKNLCSAVFVSDREPENVDTVDLNFSFIKFTKNSINYDEKSVTSHFLWGKSKAIYREGFGVTLLRDIPEGTLRRYRFPSVTNSEYSRDTISWPLGDVLPDTTKNKLYFN